RAPCGIRFKTAPVTPDNEREPGPRCIERVPRLAVCTAWPLRAGRRRRRRRRSRTGRPGASFRSSGHLLPGIAVVEDISQKLLQAQLVDETALQKAALQQKTAGGSLTGNLVKIGALTEGQLLDFLAKLYGCASIDL